MESIMQLLNELEDLVEQSRSVMFSNKVAVEKDDIFAIIQEIRMDLPKEIEQSGWVLEERNRIIIEAERNAENIMAKAEEQLRYLIDEHQIVQGAHERAKQIEEDSKQNAREIRMGAFEYADKVLSQLEEQIKVTLGAFHKEVMGTEKFFNETISEIFDNRQLLRGGGKKN